MYSSENDVVLLVCEPLNHIHQDTKSARLIAVCKRSNTAYRQHTALVMWVCVCDSSNIENPIN